MESLVMLAPAGQARAPTQAPGLGALVSPPGATVAFPWEVSLPGTRGLAAGGGSPEVRAAFAALLRQLLGGVAPRQAPDPATPAEAITAPASEEGAPSEKEAQRIEEGPNGAKAAWRTKRRTDAGAPEEPVTTGAATAPTPMPLDLIQEADSSEPAPEPTEASAADGMTVTAVSPSGTTSVPSTTAASRAVGDAPPAGAAEAPPARAAAAAEREVASAQGSPAASRQAPAKADMPTAQDRKAQEASTAPSSTAEAGSKAPARREPAPAIAPAAARADEPREARRLRLDGAETAPRAGEPSVEPANRLEGNALTGAAGAEPGPEAGSDIRHGADLSPDVEGETSEQLAPDQRAQAPSARVQSASDAARPAQDEAPTRPAPAAAAAPAVARDVETGRPGRRQQGTPAEGTPEVLPGSAQTTVVQWLHGSERVDEGEALPQAQRILVSNLVEDIRRLTFVGQNRAVLQLQPPDLGKLSIHLSMENGGLSVEMVVETEAVKAIVESTLGQLQSALAQHGLATSGVFVGVGQSAHRDAEAWHARRGREARPGPPGLGRIEAPAAPPRVRAAGYGSTVDLRI